MERAQRTRVLERTIPTMDAVRILENWQILRLTRAAELPQLGLNCVENRSYSDTNKGRHLWKVSF